MKKVLTDNNITKFDKVIMNPPYDGDGNKPALSAQIMCLAYKCTDELVSICPPTMVTYNKGDKYKEFIDEMNYHCVDFHPVDSSLFRDIAINRIYLFHFKKNVHSDIDLNDLKWTLYSNPVLVKNINNKIRQYINLTGNNLFKTELKPLNKDFVVNKDKYYVYTSKIRGHMKNNIPSWDWTTLLSPSFKVEKGTISNHTFACWAFDSEEEAKSFVDWINTDEFMFSLFLVKEGMANNHNTYEFLPNISSPKLDWKLTNEECLYIKDFMRPFGWKSQNVSI